MPTGDVETYHRDGAWHNRIEGTGVTVPESYVTKHEAVEAGREMARQRKVEHIIRNENGQIGERTSYGHDPRGVKG
ncbi:MULTISPECIES: DUF2188 domain-containing protein [Actinomycetes]|uniref:DUF2188 domain-containing protein n=1 Tax=Agrococcus casei LMG 22410 TaxID=1255656 RepID=A0A1R4FHT8_9MICO|nr:DUF2188 domain-containing protein [Agrococcus casei]SJM55515.1 hypothetical protein CZ674_04595 [Agrococcus casei LMG 22410]